MDGQIVATKLMLELTGARLVGGTIDVGGAGAGAGRRSACATAKVERLLGTAVPRERERAGSCARSEFGVAEADDGLDVTVPAFRRNDVTREADLVEEVARLWGLEKLPATLPSRRGAAGRLEPEQRLRRRVEDALVGAGLSEAVGWSFAAPDLPARLRLGGDDLRGRPVRAAQPDVRGAVDAAHHAARLAARRRAPQPLARDARRAAVRDRRDLPRHAARRRAARDARAAARRAHAPRRAADRRDAPAVVARARARRAPTSSPPRACSPRVLGAIRADWAVEPASEPFLHPGRAARVLIGGEPAGWLGELHPAVAAGWDVERRRGASSSSSPCSSAQARLDPHFRDLTSFPSVRQDRAWWFPADGRRGRRARRRARGGRRAAAPAPRSSTSIPPSERMSLALRLEFRAADRTLTDEEVAQRRAKIDAAVAERLGGEPRG